MAYLATGGPILLAAAGTGWAFDNTQNDLVPTTAALGPNDLKQSVGRQLGSGINASRALVNQHLPVGLYMVQTVAGAETNTFTTRVSITGTLVNSATSGDAAQVAGTFPANALSVVGRTIRIRAGGTCGTTGTPNLTIDYALGANILATTGVLAMQAVTSPAIWWSEVQATVTTAGSSGVVISNGHFSFSGSSGVLVTPWTMGNTTRGTGLSVDLTATQAFTINATCGTSNASNRIICTNLTVEILF